MIVATQVRNLRLSEVNYLRKEENIPEENHQLYHDLMTEGPCCILMVSKLAGVQDAKAILNGATPFGRKRMNQPSETGQKKFQMSSVDAMFELSPFSSFLELFDLQDFLTRNQRLNKLSKEAQLKEYVGNQINFNAQQINLYSRFFNFTGYSSKDLPTAQFDNCWFMPQEAAYDDIVLILLPQYNGEIEQCFEMLVRQGYRILQHKSTSLSIPQVEELYGHRLSTTKYAKQTYNNRFFLVMTEQPVHVFHLQKIAADREARAMWKRADVQIDDLISKTNFPQPYKPAYIPYMFLYLDDLESREVGLALIYNVRHLVFSGLDMFNMAGEGGKPYDRRQDANSKLDYDFYTNQYKELKGQINAVSSFSKARADKLAEFASIINKPLEFQSLNKHDIYSILQYCLLVTVGEPIKVLENEYAGPARVKKIFSDAFSPSNIL